MFNPIRFCFKLIATQLSDIGLINTERGSRILDLAWPRFLTMFARTLNRTADVAMVGLSIGPAAIAGLAFANIYWGLANSFSLGLAGGTISQVSQRFGANRHQRLDLTVKQSIWVGIALAAPFILVYTSFSELLINLIGDDPMSIGLGAAYLQVLAFGLLFNVFNLVLSRTLAGTDDTWIAMSIRATGALTNILLNTIFIFGFGMGVEGAALGTVLAEGLITCWFVWGIVTGSVPIIGEFPITLTISGPYFSPDLTRQLLTISPPIMAQKFARSFARFPLFAILAFFGPTTVAAFETARRVRRLLQSTGNGFSMAASGVVGQELGKGHEVGADEYARDVIRFSATVYITTALLVFTFAQPLAHFFTDDPTLVPETVAFIRIAVISFIALGMDYTFMGILKAAGDNRWSMYGRLVGQYFALIPITYLGVITSLGVTTVFLAMIAETASAALITGHRVFSGKWKIVSRDHRPETADD